MSETKNAAMIALTLAAIGGGAFWYTSSDINLSDLFDSVPPCQRLNERCSPASIGSVDIALACEATNMAMFFNSDKPQLSDPKNRQLICKRMLLMIARAEEVGVFKALDEFKAGSSGDQAK